MQQPRVSWATATDDREILCNSMKSIELPLTALTRQHVCYRDVEHRCKLEKYARDILDNCYSSGLDTIPKVGPAAKLIPGWTECVEPFMQKSVFIWYALWIDCGRPKTGPVAYSYTSGLSLWYQAYKAV
jgi:hypothetical protein